jgi:hypothetical protein
MTHTSYLHDTRGHGGPRKYARLCSLVAALLVWVALPGVSRAQTPGETSVSPAEQAAVQDEKSPLVAFALPIAATSLSVLLTIPGENPLSTAGVILFLVGPSAGHIYAGETETALFHAGLRTAAAATVLSGAVWLLVGTDCSLLFDDECEAPAGPTMLLVGGFVVGTASAIYSIVDAPYAARRQNRKANALRLLLTPAPIVGPDHSAGVGVQLGGRF